MDASLDDLVGVLQGWMESKSLLHVRSRRADLDLAFDGRVVSVERAGFRLMARFGGLVITISLEPQFVIEYDDVPPAPAQRFHYHQGVRLFYPSAPGADADFIVIAQVREEQIV